MVTTTFNLTRDPDRARLPLRPELASQQPNQEGAAVTPVRVSCAGERRVKAKSQRQVDREFAKRCFKIALARKQPVTICSKADTCPKLAMVGDHDLEDYGEAMRKVCKRCNENGGKHV